MHSLRHTYQHLSWANGSLSSETHVLWVTCDLRICVMSVGTSISLYIACFSSVQLLNCVQLFVTLWTAARQASLSISNSQSLTKLMSIESVIPSPGFNPWIRKIPWRREQQPTPIFLPGEFHGQKSFMGHSPWGCKDTNEQLTHMFIALEIRAQLNGSRSTDSGTANQLAQSA